jgi:hypothetical protein
VAGPVEGWAAGPGDPDPQQSASNQVDLAHTVQLVADLLTLPVDGAGISVRSSTDNNQLVHASDAVIAALDDLQFSLGEGPCLDTYRDRAAVLVADLNDDRAFARWPGFAHEATQAGARAVFAFPLQIGSAPFGAVELYRGTPGPLSEHDTAIALLIVDDLVQVVLDDLAGPAAQLDPTRHRPVPLFGRPEIPQATGMIAVQLDVSIPQALAHLRAHAFAARRTVQDTAQDVIDGRLIFSFDRA